MICTRKAALSFSFLLPGILLSGGCGGGHHDNGPGDAPENLFGAWRLVETSGGITGQGFPIADPPPSIYFEKDGTVTRNGGGSTTYTTANYTVKRRKSLTGGDAIVSVIEYSDGSVSEIIAQLDGSTLRLDEDANDGFSRTYSRIVYAE